MLETTAVKHLEVTYLCGIFMGGKDGNKGCWRLQLLNILKSPISVVSLWVERMGVKGAGDCSC